ncbi:unnamed protein product [Phytophthora fragariaefolia]|uniref:Unnamed protein product n=1 Tax=Phytophthora fragariaefolia TaxID=1490495 RepID=A0A9W7D023_9STRA|nr:unnamed protein product [Phytophthora fragariaefolia]
MLFVFQYNESMIAILVLISTLHSLNAAASMSSTTIYKGLNCSGIPLAVSVVESGDCEATECMFFITNGFIFSSVTTCVDKNRETYVADTFAGSSYLLVETFTANCNAFLDANAYLASGECQVYDNSIDNTVVAKLHEDGSASIAFYNGSSCSGTPFQGYAPTRETLANHSCFMNYSVFYTSADWSDESTSSSAFTSTRPSGGSDYVVGSSMYDSASHEESSEAGANATVSITPSDSSGGINTGAIIGILVAYILLSLAACILCMDKMERLGRRLGLRR